MVNPSKIKGTAWETATVNYLIEKGWPFAERRALNGALDKGDITGVHPLVVIENKNCKTLAIAGWVTEAETERDNAKAEIGAVWYKRRGYTSPSKGIVAMSGETFTFLLKKAGY